MDEDYGSNGEGVTDSPKRGPTLSTSTSSFEPFDAHDPNLSRLATKMFQKTGEYVQHELGTAADDYKLIESMNRAMMGKVQDMKQMSQAIATKNAELNRKYEELKPLLQKVEDIEATVDKLEAAAYQLDSYTIRLENKFKALKTKK
ncbi:biogenesis of lysosome-related organelles complex 1 subunit 2 [Uranotaenia lowii]|uniref:biogenesis of lysosome-related organelles complex 1 subunit 2 n=1 Tax=Uranotaenia lowii TaxID=190385 RepID=UPI0024799B6F|nr:biogenesis of lysosome-related organelles complex 1 subunit 2 [Uranotaenia lowii]